MNIAMALLALGFLIFIHELGHYWAARATGVRVEEFAVGFGPSIFKHKRNGIVYRLNWIPLGGYVRMLGEDNPEAAAAPDNFNNRPIAARILVIVAGVLMNMLGAFVILALLFNIYGRLETKVYVHEVMPNSPAQAAGLQAGDQLLRVAGIDITSHTTFTDEVKKHENQPLPIEILRDGKQMTVTPVPQKKGDQVLVGVVQGGQNIFVKQGTFGENTAYALQQTGELTKLTFDGFRQLVTGNIALKDIGGPVEIVRITGQASETGAPQYMYVVALLSINLAVLNIMPFPALDGGRLVFLLLEWFRRGKRISVEREASINFVGILLLLTLMVVVTFKDVFNLFAK